MELPQGSPLLKREFPQLLSPLSSSSTQLTADEEFDQEGASENNLEVDEICDTKDILPVVNEAAREITPPVSRHHQMEDLLCSEQIPKLEVEDNSGENSSHGMDSLHHILIVDEVDEPKPLDVSVPTTTIEISSDDSECAREFEYAGENRLVDFKSVGGDSDLLQLLVCSIDIAEPYDSSTNVIDPNDAETTHDEIGPMCNNTDFSNWVDQKIDRMIGSEGTFFNDEQLSFISEFGQRGSMESQQSDVQALPTFSSIMFPSYDTQWRQQYNMNSDCDTYGHCNPPPCGLNYTEDIKVPLSSVGINQNALLPQSEKLKPTPQWPITNVNVDGTPNMASFFSKTIQNPREISIEQPVTDPIEYNVSKQPSVHRHCFDRNNLNISAYSQRREEAVSNASIAQYNSQPEMPIRNFNENEMSNPSTFQRNVRMSSRKRGNNKRAILRRPAASQSNFLKEQLPRHRDTPMTYSLPYVTGNSNQCNVCKRPRVSANCFDYYSNVSEGITDNANQLTQCNCQSDTTRTFLQMPITNVNQNKTLHPSYGNIPCDVCGYKEQMSGVIQCPREMSIQPPMSYPLLHTRASNCHREIYEHLPGSSHCYNDNPRVSATPAGDKKFPTGNDITKASTYITALLPLLIVNFLCSQHETITRMPTTIVNQQEVSKTLLNYSREMHNSHGIQYMSHNQEASYEPRCNCAEQQPLQVERSKGMQIHVSMAHPLPYGCGGDFYYNIDEQTSIHSQRVDYNLPKSTTYPEETEETKTRMF
ncbi:hypothetical protein FQA39_LY00254 [Lamprigera yunnana]|nr:hypothetical protein FQA39_LY00254 [Lamprigera yunnana]